MALSDIVNINITVASVNITQAGFGVPLILGTPSWSVDRIRFYSSITAVAQDFATTRPEYKAANAMFSQNPRPPLIAIGKLNLPPTQRRTITPTAVNLGVYSLRVGANTVTFTADASATATEIVTGLTTPINALTGDTLTASGTTTLVLTGDAAGNWDDVEVLDPTLLSLAQDHADPGVATDLAQIKTIDNTWYAICNPWNSQAMALGISAWAESNTKFFLAATQDSQCILVTDGSATDVMHAAKVSAYFRSSFWYHPANGQFLDAGLLGRTLPLDPGSETWAFKTIAGTSATRLTDTQRANVLGKNGNVYETVSGVNITQFGKMASGEYIDVIRFRDWVAATMSGRVLAALARNNKIPYTDQGISALGGEVRATLRDGVRVGGIATDPAPQVFQGKAKDANPVDKAARVLKLLSFSFTLAGAVHVVDPINGSVSA